MAPAPPLPSSARGLPLAVTGTVLAWATGFVAIRATSGDFDAGAMALGRLTVAATALLLAAALLQVGGARWPAPTSREWMRLAVSGFLVYGAYNTGLGLAGSRLDAGTSAAVVIGTTPVAVVVVSAVVLGERLTVLRVSGLCVAVCGVLLVGRAHSGLSGTGPWGVLAAVGAAVVYGVGLLVQKPLLDRLPALQVTAVSCAFGAVTCVPAAPTLLEQIEVAGSGQRWLLLYLGLVPLALAFLLWTWAMARSRPSRLILVTYSVPVAVSLFSWLLLAEVPPPAAAVGGGLCLVGAVLAR